MFSWSSWVSTIAFIASSLRVIDGTVTIYGVEAEDKKAQVEFVVLGQVARTSRELDINGNFA